MVIFIAIFVMEHHWKNLSSPRGDSKPASLVSVDRHMLGARPSNIPKKRMHHAQSQATLSLPFVQMLILTP